MLIVRIGQSKVRDSVILTEGKNLAPAGQRFQCSSAQSTHPAAQKQKIQSNNQTIKPAIASSTPR
jgi:hypothetical protein